MPFFLMEIEDQKGDTFHHLFDQNLSFAEIAKVHSGQKMKILNNVVKFSQNFFFLFLRKSIVVWRKKLVFVGLYQ